MTTENTPGSPRPCSHVRRWLRLRWLPAGLAVAGAAMALALPPESTGSAEAEIVARVNGEVVTRADLRRALGDPADRRRLERSHQITDPGDRTLADLALEELVHRRLLLQEAERREISVSEEEVDQALLALRSRFVDLPSLALWMSERGLDDRSLLDTLRQQVAMRKVWTELVAGTSVSDAEALGYYEAHPEGIAIGEEVRLRVIAVDSMAAAEEILADLREGESFSRLAWERSLGLRASRGGDTGWIAPGTIPSPIQQAVRLLEVGDVAGPLGRDDHQFLIVGLVGRRPVLARAFSEARQEVERRLLPALQEEAMRAWLKAQVQASEIELLSFTGKDERE